MFGIATNYAQIGAYRRQEEKAKEDKAESEALRTGMITPEVRGKLIPTYFGDPYGMIGTDVETGDEKTFLTKDRFSAKMQDLANTRTQTQAYQSSIDSADKNVNELEKDWRDFYNKNGTTAVTKEKLMQFNVMQRGFERGGVGELAGLYAWAKLLDPGSMVKEGEIVLTQSAAPYAAKIEQYWQRATGGGAGLTPAMKKDMYDIAANIVKDQLQIQYDAVDSVVFKAVTEKGGNPAYVIPEYLTKAIREFGHTIKKPIINDGTTSFLNEAVGSPSNDTQSRVDKYNNSFGNR